MKKFEIIHTTNYMLAVSDEEIKKDVFYDITTKRIRKGNGDVEGYKKYKEFFKKIIAYQPKSNALELDLPLLPELVIEDDVEKLAEGLLMAHPDFKAEGMSEYQNGRYNGIIEGLTYKAATKIYSEEDLRKAYEDGFHSATTDSPIKDFSLYFEYEFKQPKTPKWFVAEMERVRDWDKRDVNGDYDVKIQLKTITDVDYNDVLVGYYEY